MFTFATPSPTGTSCQAHFYTWTQLSELCSTLLTGFFERPTPVQAVGETNLDSWSLKFLEAPISHDDLEAHASDDGIWFTGVAMYARQQYEGRNYETSRNQTEGVI